ncbi:hypothetical protein [Agromyces albus]|uniref:Uncharacterized protein n=1 Tax=Agromyces albus TaxID=205332 RepID=A0A4Q2L2V6_9MICO|nr:hypothetical protein [Agromyces albus]RXZ71859.1 hypothetical protein ESP51_06930 [Agromyces albus]
MLLGIPLGIGSMAMVFVRAFGPLGNGWDDVLGFLPFLAGPVAAALLVGVAYGEFALARRRRLTRDHADAVVFTAEMTPALKKYLQLDPSRFPSAERVGKTPHFFTAVASSDGISLWYGPASRPIEFWQIDWASILDVRPEVVRLQYKTVHCLQLHTGAADGALQLSPFPERGIAVSWNRASVEQLADSLNELRRAALRR